MIWIQMRQQKKPNYSRYGNKLRDARIAQKHSKAFIESQIKLKTSVINEIENGQPRAWQGAYQIGYIRSYASFLNVELPDQILNPVLHMSSPATFKPMTDRSFILSTLSVRLALVISGAVLLSYVFWQVYTLTSPPPLNIEQPQSNVLTKQTQTMVRGKTSENTDVAINGVSILTEPDGTFSASVPLQPGINELTIVATNRLTKQTTSKRTIIADYQIDSVPQQ